MLKHCIYITFISLLLTGTGGAATITLNPGDSIQTAIDNASPGDTVYLNNGMYTQSTTLNVNMSIIIQGASETGVTIDASASAGYGIHVTASDVTLEYFTLTPSTPNYPIHASGTSNPPNGFDNLTIQYVTIAGAHQRTGFDIHGYNHVLLSHLTSSDATGGNGLQITGCVDVDLENLTTTNNAWGSLAIYASGAAYLGRGSSDVAINGASLSLGEGVLFDEADPPYYNTNITISGYDYMVRNTDFRVGAELFTYYQDTLTNAVAHALAFTGYEDASTIEQISTGDMFVAAGMSIQAAIDAADPGDTVNVGAGSYEEQLVIDGKNLTLQGAGAATTTVQSPASLTFFFTTSANNYPIVYVHEATVAVRNLTVDGLGRGNANARFMGIVYHEADGGIYSCTVTAVRNTPLDGGQHGLGIYLYNSDGTPRSMDVIDCDVNDFQKNGITLYTETDALVVDIRGNTVTGAGVLTFDNGDPAQNGIQVYGVALTGVIANNALSDIAYDNTNATTKWAATTVLDIFTTVSITDNVLSDTIHVGLYKWGAGGEIRDNTIAVKKIGVYAYGIIGTDPPEVVPAPFDASLDMPTARDKALLTVLVDDNTVTFSGPDNTDTYGISGEAGWWTDDLSFTATNNTVTGFESGVEIYQATDYSGVFTQVTATGNNLAGNDYGLRSNVDYLDVNARCNWWGDVGGPDYPPANPNPGAPIISGGAIPWPWLDGPGGTCDQYGDNNVQALAPTDCLTPTNPCVDVDVIFNRLDTSNARGVSVTFELSPELVLCTPTPPSITIATGTGSWWDTFSNTNSQIYDNGGGSYTIDLAILGIPCGPTTGGDLFTVSVAKAAGVTTDDVGTVTVTDVSVRDCANAPLPGIPGAPADVIIDLTPPAAATDLAAAPVKTGNDTDGTTKIDLTWTDPGGDLFEIWRKGYGDYPEYDDGTGAVPVPPVTVGNGWTLVATVAASDEASTDEPGARDFWYYAAYTIDACGNYSATASAMTGGTLNYHLGDVSDGTTPGQGNNSVATEDISLLGANYGITLTHGHAVNYLDVGPTTDYSVDALPTTDNLVQFEDLMMFAINYGVVSKDQTSPRPASRNEIALKVGEIGEVGRTFAVELTMAGNGEIQGVTVPLHWNEQTVRPVSMQPGDLLENQGGMSLVVSPQVGTVDAALMGVRERGISGEGLLATVLFQVVAAGDPGIRLGELSARDAQNEEVAINGLLTSTPALLPTATVLHNAVPNPFNPATQLSFDLARAGRVTLRIYGLRGDLVRTLVDAELPAGQHTLQWNGTDGDGQPVSSGAYMVRLEAPDRVQNQRITLLK